MARVLFVVPPFAGHIVPAASVARELTVRGHTVAWAAHEGVDSLLPPGDGRYYLRTLIPDEEVLNAKEESGGRWMAGFKAFWQDVMVPLTREMLPQVTEAIDQFRPDVVITDQQALAGALAARKAGLPWVTSAATFAWASEIGQFPLVQGWVDAQVEQLQREAGLDPQADADLSPQLVIAYTTEALAGPPPHALPFQFVGAPVDQRVEESEFPWQELKPVPRLFVSLGTVSHYRGAAFFDSLAEALAGEPIQVILVAPPQFLPNAPPNFLIRQWVPQLAVLQHVNAVLCNAGFSTVSEVLSQGLPMVLAPIAYDSSIVAEKVTAAGAGLRVRFYRTTAAELRDAVRSVMDHSSFRQAAATIQSSFAAAGGASAAVDAIEQRILANGRSATMKVTA